jgi:HECT-domain (ubiquitin-transferase)
MLDLDRREISFSLNGASMGVAWSGDDVPKQGSQVWYPAWTFAAPTECHVNFGWHGSWKFAPPFGYLGVWDAEQLALGLSPSSAGSLSASSLSLSSTSPGQSTSMLSSGQPSSTTTFGGFGRGGAGSVASSSAASSSCEAPSDSAYPVPGSLTLPSGALGEDERAADLAIPRHVTSFASNVALLRSFAERSPLGAELWRKANPNAALIGRAKARHWSMRMDEQLVRVCNDLIGDQNALYWQPETFAMSESASQAYLLIAEVPVDELRVRAALLKQLNVAMCAMLPYANFGDEHPLPDGVAGMLLAVKSLMFTKLKVKWLEAQIKPLRGSRGCPEVTVRRVSARALGGGGAPKDRYTTFGQLFRQLASQSDNFWQRGTNTRAWETKFAGEGAIDDGGPYRESFSWWGDDVCSTRLSLMVPTPNGQSNVGLNKECFVPNPAATHRRHLDMLRFLGKLIGLGLYTGQLLNLRLPCTFWKPLVGDPLCFADLQDVDAVGYEQLQNWLEQPELAEQCGLTFVTNLPNGTIVELLPDGANIDVTAANVKKYVSLAVDAKLGAADVQMGAVLSGAGAVVPLPLLRTFTWRELERLCCGLTDYDVDELKASARVGASLAGTATLRHFWSALKSFAPEERAKFLRFAWGQGQLPPKTAPTYRDISLAALSCANPDQALPKCATCYFKVQLPLYTTEAACRRQLLYAINNCVSIDTDTSATAALSFSSSSSGSSD